MAERKHTELPWHLHLGWIDDSRSQSVPLISPFVEDCFGVNDQPAKANMELIVRCVNNHYQLVEALKDMTRIARAASFGVTGNAKRIAKADEAIKAAEQE